MVVFACFYASQHWNQNIYLRVVLSNGSNESASLSNMQLDTWFSMVTLSIFISYFLQAPKLQRLSNNMYQSGWYPNFALYRCLNQMGWTLLFSVVSSFLFNCSLYILKALFFCPRFPFAFHCHIFLAPEACIVKVYNQITLAWFFAFRLSKHIIWITREFVVFTSN